MSNRDKSHAEQVERWAEFVKSNPQSVWKKETKNLIDSQIIIARRFYENLEKSPEGKEILKRLIDEKKKVTA